jgi:4-diphosphocytidyl-2-C-methyl-D-erythritol kinase
MTTKISAPAKLTTRLKIRGTRTDGYHLIDAEMVSLDLCDHLEIVPGQTGIEVTGPYASGVPTDHTNLVQIALNLVNVSARIHIHKLIPHGGGLGGGSSDAAAILRWAGFDDLVTSRRTSALMWPTVWWVGAPSYAASARSLPHCPTWTPSTRLIIPPLAVNTPAAYRAFDELIAADPRYLRASSTISSQRRWRWFQRWPSGRIRSHRGVGSCPLWPEAAPLGLCRGTTSQS